MNLYIKITDGDKVYEAEVPTSPNQEYELKQIVEIIRSRGEKGDNLAGLIPGLVSLGCNVLLREFHQMQLKENLSVLKEK